MFWKKKETTPLKSDEYEEVIKKITTIVGDIDVINNRLSILNGNWRKLSAKVAVQGREVTHEESEEDEKVFLGQPKK